jgi:hypothetical protein
MAAYNKFDVFVQDEGRKVHNLNADVLKVLLTDVLPVRTNVQKTDITEIAAGNGYVAGGPTVPTTAYSQVSGLGTLSGGNVVVTATGGSIAQFRYAVLYNSTPAAGPLIAWFDYGTEVNLVAGSSFTIAWSGGNILTEQ